ncbi:MAG: hypothetical protein CMG00_08940 [Candidatus Marinimicrobia bacterium]|nr:hypothetical protein [Candidatus Neomarinimicrobiota bacterium]|tara:strand:+ start:8603 stop:11557 length:2955 start_codon:yes stop_codon:yes gene_type:complete
MKSIYKIIIYSITIIFSNPFLEFDKKFLTENNLKKTNHIWDTENKKKFIQQCIELDYQNIEIIFSDKKEFCDCALSEISSFLSEDKFYNEINYIYNNQKIAHNFANQMLNESMYCTINFVEELMSHHKKNSDNLTKNKSNNSSKANQKNDEKTNVTPKKESQKSTKKNNKSFIDKIKDYKKIEGLFTFYQKEDDGTMLMEIRPNQFEEIFLTNITRQSGDAFYFDGSSMQGEYPFMLKKVGNKVQFVEVNVNFRADKNLPISKAIKNHIPNSILTSTKILTEPHKDTGAYLIDASAFFIRDIGNVGSISSINYKFDKTNSYFNYIKSFLDNSEIDVTIHYKSSRSNYRFTLADSRSMVHKYHISITRLPNSSYKPRLADDRVGHFLTIYQDYSDTFKDIPDIRYINRWNLKKKNPNLNLSEPVEPIVFWIENTVPHEFRSAIKEGILKWNLAFEKIGFKNAIVAKQMPDNADWDPADTRYNTIRWMIQPGNAYAVGPSRANPFTGEIYDADIRIGSDFVRYYYTDFAEYIDPLDLSIEENNLNNDHNHEKCEYHNIMNHKMTYAWNYFTATGQIDNNKTNFKKFVHDGLVDLILHEVGHTLGLRHNFKASSVFSLEEISNPNFTEQYGVTGSVMDYNATNLFDGGKNYFQTVPGHYDYWAIEYAYAEQPPYSKTPEKDFLEKIASKSTNPLLAYGTDEDAGSRGIDPYINRRDMTSNPIEHYAKRIELGNQYINSILDNFEKNGQRYPKIRSLFYEGFYEYYRGVASVYKFIGGIKHSRHHVGQKYNDLPLETIDLATQKAALDFYKKYIFDKNAFKFDSELLNKMAPERLSDLEGSVYRMSRLDFPLHSVVKSVQKSSLRRLFDTRTHNRIIDNTIKTSEEQVFELSYLFNEISESIWYELSVTEDINSFRRQLQTMHIEYLIKAYENKNEAFPNDSQSLARLHLSLIHTKINEMIAEKSINDYTLAHLMKVSDSIKKSLDLE